MLVVSGPGNDAVNGGAALDFFDAGSGPDGSDRFDGKQGIDLLSYANRSGDVHVAMNGAADDGEAGEGDNVTLGVENLQLGPGDDEVVGSKRSNDIRDLAGGDNVISGGRGNDTFATQAGLGADLYHGGKGRDRVIYGSLSNLTISLDGLANDGVIASMEHDNMFDDVENVNGGQGSDIITGSGFANRLDGGPGNDQLFGFGGKDRLVDSGTSLSGGTVFTGDDRFSGGTEVDTVDFSIHAFQLSITIDGVQNDTSSGHGTDNVGTDVENVIGGTAGDLIVGSALANRLSGRDGGDSLSGLGGNDTLLGGDGNDGLNGGADIDHCEQGAGTGSIIGCES
jgi:Ca2+-binding RTX toxin-like protein